MIQGTAPLFYDSVYLTQPSDATYLKVNDEYQTFAMVRGCQASLFMMIASCSLLHYNQKCISNCSNIACHTRVECHDSHTEVLSVKIQFNWENLIGLNLRVIDADNSSSFAVQTTVSFCRTYNRITSCGPTAQLFISGLPLASTESSASLNQSTSATPPAA